MTTATDVLETDKNEKKKRRQHSRQKNGEEETGKTAREKIGQKASQEPSSLSFGHAGSLHQISRREESQEIETVPVGPFQNVHHKFAKKGQEEMKEGEEKMR
jgi:hypothetical protein